MKALGFIETRGLLAAIESADAMLKSADVTLLNKTYVGGGLVSVAVTGDVAAVKAAVEAGAAVIGQMNSSLLISQHVIPRPHDSVGDLLTQVLPPETDAQKHENVENESVENVEGPAKDFINEPALTALSPEEKKTEAEAPIEEESVQETVSEAPEAEAETLPQRSAEAVNKAAIDKIALESGVEKTLEFLSTQKVSKLRNLAREYKDFSISGRRISKADGRTLLKEFQDYYQKN
jgi:microcompartment protein CcmL/EutN